ncbi:type 1 glutamine amidotransferase [Aidingimonas halophila]|uniref:GMP synthase-Glutamine amidotransferase n=1 Tax=Aidingimonas halophila TaxID=574349 RepID=A0A1H2Z276_9GAMM|nr:type 1 glutamine amidotransferase [Aidingimonas halophila]GHC15179.1 GMP synthase [Aidingimonas halophila]SDX11014.1 GMP synthase-Glutamine amidotransferase [Aidingimonas halophila]
MHIYFLEHADYIGPARLADWLIGMGHSHNSCRLHQGEALPRLADCDGLIVLDAPMNIANSPAPEWIKRERKLITRTLKSGKPLLGIGFGARLIATELGAIASPGPYTEIGWYTIQSAPDSAFDLPEQFDAFLWQNEILALPEGTTPLGSSSNCPVQGFSWDRGRVVAMQCHLEATQESAQALLEITPSSLTETHAEQIATVMAGDPKRFDHQASLLDRVLLQWLRTVE